jgi:hypothetical protein
MHASKLLVLARWSAFFVGMLAQSACASGPARDLPSDFPLSGHARALTVAE